MKLENVADIYPLSHVQVGMLFHTLAAPSSGVYVEQYTCKLKGELQQEVFELAWKKIIERHPALRTAFVWQGLDESLQIVRQQVKLPWNFQDWRGLSSRERELRLAEFLKSDRLQGFELEQAPLIRLMLIQLETETYQFIWSFHHLLCDGWSTSLVWREVLTLYESFCRGKNLQLPNIRPYRDYIAWLQAQNIDRAKVYWQNALKGFTETTPIPFTKTNSGLSYSQKLLRRPQGYIEVSYRIPLRIYPFRDTFRYETMEPVLGSIPLPPFEGKRLRTTRGLPAALTVSQERILLTSAISESLQSWARQHRLTLNTVINGAWALLLSRYSGEIDVVYGTTISGRPTALAGVEAMVGLFINTLPVRVQVSPGQELLTWLKEIQSQLLDICSFEYAPLREIQKWSEIAPGHALFESIVVFENYPLQEKIENQSLTIDDVQYLEQSNYPLALLIVPGKSLELILIYDTSRFQSAAVKRMLGHIQTVLEGFVKNPHSALVDLPLLTPAELHQLLVEWNQPQSVDRQEAYIHDLFEAQVAKNPEAIAVTFKDEQLTYGELYQRASRLASHLQSLGVGSNVLVGICLERSLEMVVGILGILMAGGAYVPLDPDYPQERLDYIVEDSEISILLTQTKYASNFVNENITVINLDFCLEEDKYHLPLQHPSTPAPLHPSTSAPLNSDNLAYVIYTSGSTGKPKGVLVAHRNLIHSTIARIDYYTQPVDRFLLLSSFAFDSSVAGIFWTLCQGGTLVLSPPRLEQDMEQLAGLIARQKISHILCLPSLYSLLLTYAPAIQLQSLQVVIVAGEASSRSLASQHHAILANTFLYNEYGPTEATVWSSVYRVPPTVESPTIPIGTPITNTQIYLLDVNQKLVPIGIPGEVYIGGAGVSLGYLNQAERTAKQFIVNPFSQDASDRLYRTGDMARYNADGNIEFMGRIDRQVKIRGYRIELDEIEDALRQQDKVREALVVPQSITELADSVESIVENLIQLTPERAEALLRAVEEED